MVQHCKVISNSQMEEYLHSDRFVCTDAHAFMRFRAVERHLRWPSQVTLSPPKAKLFEDHWQRFWAFAAGTLQCCCGHLAFHGFWSADSSLITHSLSYYTTPLLSVDGANIHQTG